MNEGDIMIYLDNSATTPPFEEVMQAVMEGMQISFYNPSALYGPAVDAYREMKHAREVIASMAGANAQDLIFTSGGTESNNLAIIGGRTSKEPKGVIYSLLEHPSVREPVRHLIQSGYSVRSILPSQTGEITAEQVLDDMDAGIGLVCLMHVQNEIGSVTDVNSVARDIKKHYPDVKIHIDGIQAFGRIPVDLMDSQIDSYAISAHKLHGPKGIGGLFINKDIKLRGYQMGGGQEGKRRSGTENLPGIMGFATATQAFAEHGAQWIPRMRALKVRLAEALLDIPDAILNGPDPSEGAPHILSVSFLGMHGETLVHAMETQGVLAGIGSACSSRYGREQSALSNLGMPKERVQGAIRFSLSVLNTQEEIDQTAEVVRDSVRYLSRFKKR